MIPVSSAPPAPNHRLERLNAHDHSILDYARPDVRPRRRPASLYVALYAGGLGIVAACCIPSTVGSGVIVRNPIAAAAGYLVWLASIAYVWLRAFEGRPTSRPLAGFVALCGTVAVIAAPMQLDAWAGDPGYPQSRLRLALLWPGIVTGVACLGAALGRGLIRKRR